MGEEETEKERGRKKRFASKLARLVQFLLGKQRLLSLTDQITFSTALDVNMRLLVHFPVSPDEQRIELGPHHGQAQLYHRGLVTLGKVQGGEIMSML